MDVRRAIQLASLIVIVNATAALLYPRPAGAGICSPIANFCDDIPCTNQNYATLCRIELGVTCPCKVCEGLCVNVETCAPGQTLGFVTCLIGDPAHPCP